MDLSKAPKDVIEMIKKLSLDDIRKVESKLPESEDYKKAKEIEQTRLKDMNKKKEDLQVKLNDLKAEKEEVNSKYPENTEEYKKDKIKIIEAKIAKITAQIDAYIQEQTAKISEWFGNMTNKILIKALTQKAQDKKTIEGFNTD